MKKIYIIIFLLCLAPAAFSQFYNKEVGIRGGYSSGITFRVNLEESLSYEAQLNYRDKGAVFTMYRQQHSEMEWIALETGNSYMDSVSMPDFTIQTLIPYYSVRYTSVRKSSPL